jgi:glycoprotein endo-alpha-1,2-mannosidase
MRWLALLAAAALLFLQLPSGPSAAEEDEAGDTPSARLHAFYYPWYGTPEVDGGWSHWNHEVLDDSGLRFPGGDDIGANFYPLAGCTSSNSEAHVERHMRELRRARVGVLCVSWWGVDSFSDRTLPLLFRLAEKHGIAIDLCIGNW